MLMFKSSLISVFVLLTGFLCLLKPSQAVCLIDISRMNDAGDIFDTFDTCSLSLNDCSNITAEALKTNYGLRYFEVTPGLVSRVTLSGGDLKLVKTALAPYLLACYNYKTQATTFYGK